jgi:pyruvate dehydrogenase E2 component (dihydrolipoamide acetyltransferase)
LGVVQEVLIPDIGDIDEVQVIEVCVQPGVEVSPGDPLIVIESDKASMEVPSETAGTVSAVLVQVGDMVSQGHPVISLVGEDPAAGQPVAAEPVVAPAEVADEVAADEAAMVEELSVDSPVAADVLEVRVPDIGEATDVVVIEVAVQPGQRIAADDLLVVVESDKASMEIPAGQAGTVLDVHVTEGSSVVQGTLLVTLESAASLPPSGTERSQQSVPAPAASGKAPAASGKAPAASDKRPAAQQQGSAPAQPVAPVPAAAAAASGSGIYAGPAVRRLARELGVDLSAVDGSGSRGRIVKDDVKSFVKHSMQQGGSERPGIPPVPQVDFSKFGPTESVALTRVQALGATNLQRSWLNIPHVTQHDEADVTELELFRASLKNEAKRRGVKITPLAFIVKACCYALKEFPTFNSSLDADGKNFILKRYYHIGFAVDTAQGLLVPVLKDADKKGVWELSEEITELADKAREQKFGLGDLQGASFSVSSLGAIGGTGFTPIINAPEVAILGVARLATRPVWDGEAFVPRQMLPLSLSYDHRAINGAEAGRFVTYLSDLLSDIRRLSL